jgi:hypothetical protein
MMNDLGPGFPEWTELGQDGGLDPLGMQRPIEAIYQSLLPGISTITLRFRYYSFFPWILEVYARNEHNTDPAAFRVFQRRCETLFALICCRGDPELGVAGIDWAQRQLSAIEDQSDESAVIDFSTGADPATEETKRYLRNKGGAFGGIYATQMSEMGLIHLGDQQNPIAVCTTRALPLAEVFGAQLGALAKVFLGAVKVGQISIFDLDRLAPIKPSAIIPQGEEHHLLADILLGKAVAPTAADITRRHTMLMLLRLTDANKGIPRSEDAKWEWFSADHVATSDEAGTEGVQALWSLYQACDLMRLAYENILSVALLFLESAPSRRLTLDAVMARLMGSIDPPSDLTWQVYAESLVADDGAAASARRAAMAMSDAMEPEDRVKASVALIAALLAKASGMADLMDASLNTAEHFQSLRTEVRLLKLRSADSASSVIETVIRDRILKRHLWVASRKFQNQKAYTFLMEPEDGVLRYRGHFSVSPSSPRLDQALRFLRDIKFLDSEGLTDLGRNELVGA